jgi:glycosyltransferase involved in cell wall biosynthesis
MPADVSVIIPTFNRLWCLPKAIESCRNSICQTEIIVVDDGSTDGTWEWLQKQKDVVALRQANWGKDWAVNAGFAQAEGEYVRFLDSDDWLLEGAIDSQLALARKENADVVVAGYEIYDEKENLIGKSPWFDCDDFIAQQLGECDSSHYSAYLFRRAFIENIPHRQEFGVRDDRMFVIEVAMTKPKVAVCEQLAFVHRQHSQNRLQFPDGMRAVQTNYQHLQIYRKALGQLETRGELTPRRKKAAVKVLWPLAHWIAYTHLEEACEVADWVFKLDPEFQIPEQGILGRLYRGIGFRRTEQVLALRRALLRPFNKSA